MREFIVYEDGEPIVKLQIGSKEALDLLYWLLDENMFNRKYIAFEELDSSTFQTITIG